MKLIRHKRAWLMTLGLLMLLFIVPWMMLWRQYRLDHDLIAAVKRNDTRAAVTLLNRGANANVHDEPRRDISPWSLLLDRLRGKPALLSTAPTPLLLALEPINKNSKSGPAVCLPENLPLVTALLDHGAGIDTVDSNGMNPLNLAILSGKNATAHLLLTRGAHVQSARVGNNLLSVPLIWACSYPKCSLDVISDLLDHGANIDDQDSLGRTALHVATAANRPDVVRFLLARHANPNLKDWRGRTPLAWVRHFPNVPDLQEVASLLEQVAAAK